MQSSQWSTTLPIVPEHTVQVTSAIPTTLEIDAKLGLTRHLRRRPPERFAYKWTGSAHGDVYRQ